MRINGLDDRKQIGAFGEAMAEAHLRKQGYTILTRNWRCKTGEIDIVAETDGRLVFVEVRTRRSNASFGLAKESVDYRKQKKVREAAQYFIRQHKRYEQSIRFDVISVQLSKEGDSPELEHIQGAF